MYVHCRYTVKQLMYITIAAVSLLLSVQYYSFSIATRITYWIPCLTPQTMWLVDWVGFHENTHRVDKSYEIFNDYFELPIHQEGEIIVDYEHTVEALKAVKKVVIDNQFPVNYITEVHTSTFNAKLILQEE